jgi:iron(III) transport system permease protein
LRSLGTYALTGFLALIVLGVVVAPLLKIVDLSLLEETDLGVSDTRSFVAIAAVYTTWEYLGPLISALVLALVVTVISVAIGTGMAVVVARTDVRWKPVWDVSILVPLFLSPFMLLIAWISLAGPRTGFLNGIASALVRPFTGKPFDIVNLDTYWGIVWVMVIVSCPLVYLFTVGTLRSMDASLEEASRSVGASPLHTIFTITVPVCLPSILSSALVVFVLTLETYTVPGIIGAAFNFTTLPWKIYDDATNVPPHLAHAAAAGTLLLFITAAGIWLQRRITRFSNRYVTVSGKGARAKSFRLGSFRPLAMGLLGLYVFCAAVLPLGALLLASFMRFTAPIPTWKVMWLGHYSAFFYQPNSFAALPNTIILAIGSGLICVVIGALISMLDIRSKRWWARSLAAVGVLPVAVPGIIFGIGLLWVYIRSPLYGTIWIIMLAYVARFLPYGIVISRSAIVQIDKSLEESARMSGAGSLRVMLTIMVPLIKSTLLAIFFLVMMLCVKEVPASLLLFTPRSQVLSTLAWQYVASGDFQYAAMVGVIQTLMLVLLVVFTRMLFGLRLERAMGKN